MLDAVFGAITVAIVTAMLVAAVEFSEQVVLRSSSQPLSPAEQAMLGLSNQPDAVDQINQDLVRIAESLRSPTAE